MPRFQAIDQNGRPMVGSTLYTYQNKTTTPHPTWKDREQTAYNTNPIVLDARGEAVIWLDPEQVYTFVLRDSFGVLVWSQDDVAGGAAQIDLAAPDGASMVGFIQEGAGAVPRTMLDKAREVVSVLDFGAVMEEGVDDGPALKRMVDYLKANGGRGIIPAGTLYSETYRVTHDVATEGTYKPFEICGFGKDVTFLKFGGLELPAGNGSGETATREPGYGLFNFVGDIDNKITAARVTLRDFTVDYSEQSYKGGPSFSAPLNTDIDPVSFGVVGVRMHYGDGMTLERIKLKDLYGDGIRITRSPNNRIVDCMGEDVFGGNIGRLDSFGGFVGLLQGAQIGSVVRDCTAINTKTYKTDTIRGYTDVSAKDTPCGYIGFWVEFATDSDGILLKEAEDLWLGATPSNNESFGCVIENCFAYGYTIGFKSESLSPTSFVNNTAVHCWLPFVSVGVRNSFRDNYADRGKLDSLVFPMEGYRFREALYCHFDFSSPVGSYTSRFMGTLFDGNKGYTRKAGLFYSQGAYCVARNFSLVVDCPTGNLRNLLGSNEVYLPDTIEFSAQVYYKDVPSNVDIVFPLLKNSRIDLTVVNATDKEIRFNINDFAGLSGKSANNKFNLTARGLCILDVNTSGLIQVDADMNLNLYSGQDTGITLSRYPIVIASARAVELNLNLVLPTHLLGTRNRIIECLSQDVHISGDIFMVDTGSVPGNSIIININGTGGEYIDISVRDNPYNLPLLLVPNGFSGFVTLGKNSRLGVATPLLRGTPSGPIFVEPGAQIGKLYPDGYSGGEPNAYSRLIGGRAWNIYHEGLKIPYLMPTASGKEGLVVIQGGLKCVDWSLGQSATANTTFRKNAGNAYVAATTGTTGSTAPTHTSGTVSDGGVDWTYYGPAAQFAEYGSVGSAL